MKKVLTRLMIVSLLMLSVSCNPIKQAQRKLTQAEKLIREAQVLDPTISLADTTSQITYERKPATIFSTVLEPSKPLVFRDVETGGKIKYDTVTKIVECECPDTTTKIVTNTITEYVNRYVPDPNQAVQISELKRKLAIHRGIIIVISILIGGAVYIRVFAR